MDGTPNNVDYITEVVNIMVQYRGHSEQATFHVTGISQTTISLNVQGQMEVN